MKKIYKDILIGLILASFVFTPTAFAKPQGVDIKNSVKVPSYAKMSKVIKKNKKALKVSDFIESAKPMLNKRAYKDILKMAFPVWDKKFVKFKVGQDYFKIKFKDQSLFIRYVDQGPVAFIVNDEPFLWKDFLIYSRVKARLTQIIMNGKTKKVSFIESILKDLFPKAYAVLPEISYTSAECQEKKAKGGDQCKSKNPIQCHPRAIACGCSFGGKALVGTTKDGNQVYGGCKCPNEYIFKPNKSPTLCPKCDETTNMIMENGKCNCMPGTKEINAKKLNRSCECPEGKEIVNQECIEKCKSPTTRNTEGKCSCPEDKDLVGDKCVEKCKSPTTRNTEGKCSCPNNQILKGKEGNQSCGCPEDKDLVGDKCVEKCGFLKKRKDDGTCGVALIPVLLIAAGVAGLAFLFFWNKNRREKRREEKRRNSGLPVTNWISNSEGMCPSVGADKRGIDPNDLSPQCRNAVCSGGSCENDNDANSIEEGGEGE